MQPLLPSGQRDRRSLYACLGVFDPETGVDQMTQRYTHHRLALLAE